MALDYVGGRSVTGTNGTLSLPLTGLTGGIDTQAREGDLVVVAYAAVSTSNLSMSINTSGFTDFGDLWANDTRDTNLIAGYKVMGPTPDAQVDFTGNTTSTNGAAAVCHVWRGVDASTPMDVAAVTDTGTNGAVPDPAAITPVTSDAVIVVIGAGSGSAADTSVTAPTGYGNHINASTDPGNAIILAIASKVWGGAGQEDPGAWSSWTTSTSDSRASVTLALRPQPPTIQGNLAVTLDGATVSSTASVAVAASVNATLDSATVSSTASVPVAATVNATLAPATLSATATAPAALSTKAGTFTLQNTLGNQSITGLGFQPSVVLLFSNYRVLGEAVHNIVMMGCGTDVSQWCGVYRSEDAQATTNISSAGRSDAVILVIDGAAVILTQADFVSCDADGFTVNVSTTSGGTLEVYYLAIGGSDITDVKAGSFDVSSSLGDQAVTGVGFQPDSLILWGHRNSAGLPNANNSSTSGALGFGAAGSQGYSGHRLVNGSATGDTAARQRTDNIFAYPLNTGVTAEGSLSSLDTDGFTINWSEPGASETVLYLAIKGASFKVGSFNQATATGAQGITGVGFEPSAIILSSMNGVTSTASFDNCRRSWGAATGATEQFSLWSGAKDAADPTVARTYSSASNVVSLLTEGAGGTSVTNAEAALSSFDSDGFTLDWTTADTTQREILYWAIGAAHVGVTLAADGSVDAVSTTSAPAFLDLGGLGSIDSLSATQSAARMQLQGAGQIDSSSNVSSIARRVAGAIAAIAATSSVSSIARRIAGAVASISATSTASSPTARILRSVSGAIAAASTVPDAVVSTVSGLLGSGTIAAVSAVANAIARLSLPASGSIPSNSDTDASVIIDRGVSGAIDSSSDVSSIARRTAGAVATISATSGISSPIARILRAVSGTIAAVSSLPDITVSVVRVSGAIAAISAVASAIARLTIPASASVPASSDNTGSVRASYTATASLEVISDATGFVVRSSPVTGAVDATSSVTGIIQKILLAIGSITAPLATVRVNARMLFAASSIVPTISTVSGAAHTAIFGTIAALSTALASARMTYRIATQRPGEISSLQAVSTVSGIAHKIRVLVGTIAASASVSVIAKRFYAVARLGKALLSGLGTPQVVPVGTVTAYKSASQAAASVRVGAAAPATDVQGTATAVNVWAATVKNLRDE